MSGCDGGRGVYFEYGVCGATSRLVGTRAELKKRERERVYFDRNKCFASSLLCVLVAVLESGKSKSNLDVRPTDGRCQKPKTTERRQNPFSSVAIMSSAPTETDGRQPDQPGVLPPSPPPAGVASVRARSHVRAGAASTRGATHSGPEPWQRSEASMPTFSFSVREARRRPCGGAMHGAAAAISHAG